MSCLLLVVGRGVREAAQCQDGAEDLLAHRRRRIRLGGNGGLLGRAWQMELLDAPELALPLYSASLFSGTAPLWAYQRGAACALVVGQTDKAATFYGKLRQHFAAHPYADLLHALLEQARKQPPAAVESSVSATVAPARLVLRNIDALAVGAHQSAQQGLFHQATDSYQQVLRLLDLLMLQIVCAREGEAARRLPARVRSMISALAQRADACLRCMLRAQFAAATAQMLSARHTRSDLAWWATGNAVHGLLAQQLAAAESASRQRPNHPETHYRLGLLARSAGQWELAQRAFAAVLRLQPQHMQSASRLAATCLNMHQTAAARDALRCGGPVPAATLRQCYRLALAFARPEHFGLVMQAWSARDAETFARQETCANTAFLLRSLGLFDAQTLLWHDPSAAAA